MLTMRQTTMADAELLFEWRNDPGTRIGCRNQEPIEWEGHVKWLADVLADPARALSLFEQDGVPCGTCRIDPHRTGVELSITVAPAFRRSHLATEMMRMAGPDEDMWGYIRQHNIAAQNAVIPLGFKMLSDGPLQVWFKPRTEAAAA